MVRHDINPFHLATDPLVVCFDYFQHSIEGRIRLVRIRKVLVLSFAIDYNKEHNFSLRSYA